jgi:DNA topoisomerase-3
MRVLNVAEKPSVAKEASRVLSRGQCSTETGASRYNRVHKFGFDLQNFGQCEMVFTSVVGHLMEIAFKDAKLKSWSACDPALLFTAEIEKYVRDDLQDVLLNLQQQARCCDLLILWLDCDREGENIAMEVVQACQGVKPNIQVKRARFSALTETDLFRACNTLVPPNVLDSAAVDARQEIDLRSGAAFTRLQTMRLQNKYEGLDGLISYGPCQFPTLGFIVDRWLDVECFTPEPFWTLKCQVVKESSESDSNTTERATFTWNRGGSGRVFDQLLGTILLQRCLEAGEGIITKADGRQTSKWAPTPLSTVEFQKRASRWLRISSEAAMSIAEKLYQQGILSYPRTETDKFNETMDLTALVQGQSANPDVSGYVGHLLQGNMRTPRPGGHDDQAHPPIHPTGFAPNLSGDEKKVFDFVVRHFLACVSFDAVGKRTEAVMELAEEEFVAKGLMVLEKNYLNIYPVRARPARLSALSVSHNKSVLYSAFAWARRALNSQKRRFPARAVGEVVEQHHSALSAPARGRSSFLSAVNRFVWWLSMGARPLKGPA